MYAPRVDYNTTENMIFFLLKSSFWMKLELKRIKILGRAHSYIVCTSFMYPRNFYSMYVYKYIYFLVGEVLNR